MKLVIIEPLGVNDEKLLSMAKDMLPSDLEIQYYNTRVTDTETLIERGKDADIIAVSNLPMNADVINGCKNLKMLSVAFTGVDHIAMDACKANHVLVSNCAGYSTAAVADLVFGMVIALYRRMVACNDVVRKGGTKDGLVGFELNAGDRAGAGIDVFEMEPPVPENHPLLTAKNVIATPHVAFATKEALEKRAVIVFDNIDKWIKGTPQNVM